MYRISCPFGGSTLPKYAESAEPVEQAAAPATASAHAAADKNGRFTAKRYRAKGIRATSDADPIILFDVPFALRLLPYQ
jgi:hypothetical protein